MRENRPAAPEGMASRPDPADVSKNKVFAILSYFGILFILPLLCCKDSAYGRFHANQGLLLFLLEIAAAVLGLIPLAGWVLSLLLYLSALIFFIIGLASAAQGTMTPLPLLGSIRIIK